MRGQASTGKEEKVKLIPLTKGQVAKVSDERYEELNRHKWAARWNPSTSSYYAQRTEYVGRCRAGKRTIQMHRVILGLKAGDPDVDHWNGDTLDNQDDNLRPAGDGDNAKNRRKNKNNSSGFKGVSFREKSKRWMAQIQSNGKKQHLGYHATRELAHAAYCEAATKLHGSFAKTA